MILTADGQEAIIQQHAVFTPEEARLIRAYKRLLQAHGLGATHWCRACQRAERDFELRIVANDAKVEFECPHLKIEYSGYTA